MLTHNQLKLKLKLDIMKKNPRKTASPKVAALAQHTEYGQDQRLTTNHGLPINDDQNSLKAGDRGPTLIEDFLLREKITHFDHERIPERVVHARGSGAHGFFQVYEPMARLTRAAFLQDPEARTPVFVRFSTVAGSRGSSDLARDVRGFAVKFYTEDGNFDLVGNNMPVFFIQDALKFPDLIHAVKPEPHNGMPQAASAHDTFWDFISLMPESMHMIMWVMSDRAIPRSYRMMEGFGVHTFRFINDKGKSSFVKFHWKPLLGMHSVVWDEALKISGNDPDFHRRDLWEAINDGAFPEYEMGVQIVDEKDEHKFDFDLLDPTKLIPEEMVPVRRIGKMTLNRNPDNFEAETEQVAFHVGHLVPGIDLTNDPLIHGRLFSYTDTQLTRLGGPNFHEIPINRPIAPLHNHQRGGLMRQMINAGQVSYEPNSLGGGSPAQVPTAEGGFASFAERIDAMKIRARGEKFFDHFSQATLFFRSQSKPEQDHIVSALRFELGKVKTQAIRERVVHLLSHIDKSLAKRVADGLGFAVPAKVDGPLNQSIPADGDPKDFQPRGYKELKPSPALSMANTMKGSIATRKIALLMADGFDDVSFAALKKALTTGGATVKVVAPRQGAIRSTKGDGVTADFSLFNCASVLFDAVAVVGGRASVDALVSEGAAIHFVEEAFKHYKAVCAIGEGVDLLAASRLQAAEKVEFRAAKHSTEKHGLVFGPTSAATKVAADFVRAIGEHRHWSREKPDAVPA